LDVNQTLLALMGQPSLVVNATSYLALEMGALCRVVRVRPWRPGTGSFDKAGLRPDY